MRVRCFCCILMSVLNYWIPGPIYRLPCSSTMSSYVATSTTAAGTQDSSRITSANATLPHCAMSSLYSLSEPLCRNGGGAQSGDTAPQITSSINRNESNQGFHNIYWNRAITRAAPATSTRIYNQGMSIIIHNLTQAHTQCNHGIPGTLRYAI